MTERIVPVDATTFRVERDAVLRCRLDHPDIQTVPIESLTRMVDWGQRERTVYRSLDRAGLANPILAYRCPVETWAARVPLRLRQGVRPAPIAEHDGDVHLVKFGNQRLAWALLRGWTHVPAVILDTEHDCARWLVHYLDT